MEQGLAASVAQPQQEPNGGGLPSLEQVAQMLMEGVPPEELEQMGIPPELIMEAIAMLEQQIAAEGGQPQEQQVQPQQVEGAGGLAQNLVG